MKKVIFHPAKKNNRKAGKISYNFNFDVGSDCWLQRYSFIKFEFGVFVNAIELTLTFQHAIPLNLLVRVFKCLKNKTFCFCSFAKKISCISRIKITF